MSFLYLFHVLFRVLLHVLKEEDNEEEIRLFLQFLFSFVLFLFAAFTTKYVSRKSMYAAV